MDKYIKGESIELQITLTLPDGTAIYLTSLATISISVYHSILGTVLKAGTYAGGEITYYTDGTDGIFNFYIEGGLTATASKGIYEYLITVTEVDDKFLDNTDTGKQTGNAFRL